MASIAPRKLKDGCIAYQVKVRKKGRAASGTFDRESDAMRWAEDREYEITNNLPFPHETIISDDGSSTVDTRNDMRLNDALGKFIKEMQNAVSPSQKRNYLHAQTTIIRHFGEGKGMAEISQADIAGYILKRTGVDGVGPSSIRNELSLVRRTYEHSIAWGIHLESPERNITRPKHKRLSREDKLDKIAGADELNAIFRSAKFRENNLHLYLRFLLFTGMRPSEAASLYWEKLPVKVEKEAKKKYFPIGYVDLNRGGFSKIGTKTETRFVPAHPEVLAILKTIQKNIKESGITRKLVFLDDIYIKKSRPYQFFRRSMQTTLANAVLINKENQKALRKILDGDLGPIVKEREIKKTGDPLNRDFNFYTFRHTIRSNMARCGIPTEVAETIIGHNDSSFKFTYIHLDDNVLVREIGKLDYPGLDPL